MIQPSELIDEYISLIKDEYPDISKDEIESILRISWKFIRENIENLSTTSIRLKYFGTFKIYKSRLKSLIFRYQDKLVNTEDKDKREELILKIKKYTDMLKNNKFLEKTINLGDIKQRVPKQVIFKLEYPKDMVENVYTPCKCFSYGFRDDKLILIYKPEQIKEQFKVVEKEITIIYKNDITQICVIKGKIIK